MMNKEFLTSKKGYIEYSLANGIDAGHKGYKHGGISLTIKGSAIVVDELSFKLNPNKDGSEGCLYEFIFWNTIFNKDGSQDVTVDFRFWGSTVCITEDDYGLHDRKMYEKNVKRIIEEYIQIHENGTELMGGALAKFNKNNKDKYYCEMWPAIYGLHNLFKKYPIDLPDKE